MHQITYVIWIHYLKFGHKLNFQELSLGKVYADLPNFVMLHAHAHFRTFTCNII